MKKYLIGFICGVMLCAAADARNAGRNGFIHATYSIAGLVTEAELAGPDYDNYHFIYVMGSPAWWQTDFDQNVEEVEKIADRFDYKAMKDGMALTPEMIGKAHEAGSKILLCFGGTDQFIPLMEKPERFRKLAAYILRIIDNYGFDGVDIDWELTVDPKYHTPFMGMLRNGLDSIAVSTGRQYYLTTALGADACFYDKESAEELGRIVDWINVMTYDMSDGIWGDTPEHNTSMQDLQYYLSKWDIFGRDKICAGLASYGFWYRELGPGERSEVPLKECGSYITYNEFKKKKESGWTEEYDRKAKVSYYFSPDRNEFVTIEDPESMRRKIKWITKAGYRGVFWWEYHYDYTLPDGQDRDGSHELADIVTDYLHINY